MPNTEIIILFARQYSGTNALLPILETHPQIFCLNEVFNLAQKDSSEPLVRETNFFTFLNRYGCGNISKILPDKHENLFLDYLEYLKCFSTKRYLLIPVTYDTVHFFTKPFSDNVTSPYLFDLIRAHNLKVFNLTRRNHLQYALFTFTKLDISTSNGNTFVISLDKRIYLDINFLLKELKRCKAEDELFAEFFASYRHHLSCDYVDIFAANPSNKLRKFLQQFALWLGIPNSFNQDSYSSCQLYLPLEEVVKNFREVVEALRREKFDHLLGYESICSQISDKTWKEPALKTPNKAYRRAETKQRLSA